MGPNGPLFTSIASRDTTSLIAEKLPSSLTLPTSTGGTFTASSTSIIPNNPATTTLSRTLADSSRKRANFPNRKRGDFSENTLGKLQVTKWLDWGSYASFAPDWDDGGVGGGFGAEGIASDWAYKRLRKEKLRKKDVENKVVSMEMPRIEDSIDEKMVLEWEENKPSKDLVDGELVEDNRELTVDETLNGLRGMILLLGQMQTLRMAMGKTEIPEDEKSLGIFSQHEMISNCLADTIVTTFQNLILTYSIPPNALISSLSEEAYNIITLTHPEYIGSLPARKIPSWTPPQPPQPPQPHIQQRTPYSQPQQQQPRPNYQNVNQQQQHRLAPGPSSLPYGRGPQQQMMTPVAGSRPMYNSSTPGSTPGYNNTPGQMWTPPNPAGTYRGVGRPRKYDIRK
jgi:hypothetical protein